MKIKYLVLGLLVVVLAVISVSLAVKSCRLTEEEKLKFEIKNDESDIRQIQKKRDSANSVVITDSSRAKVVESVNGKTGFNLSVRPQKSN